MSAARLTATDDRDAWTTRRAERPPGGLPRRGPERPRPHRRALPAARAQPRPRYAGRGEPFEDLVQVGSIGLLLAIERFDPERGVAFATYAVPTIVGEIQRHFRDRAWALHVPRRLKELSLQAHAHRSRTLTAELGRVADDRRARRAVGRRRGRGRRGARDLPRLLGALAVSAARPTTARRRRCRTCSAARRPASSEVEDGALVEAGLDALDARERRIVELRFFDGLTQSEIAARVGISQMHVSRLLRRALDDAGPARGDDARRT